MLYGGGSLDEPVMSLPVLGRVSFRQAGIIMGLCLALPLCVHSAFSAHVLEALPDPAFSAGPAEVGWDAVVSLIPVPVGLALGVPRPRLVPMDAAVWMMFRFALRRSSARRAPRPAKRAARGSKLAGFAPPDPRLAGAPSAPGYTIAARDPSVPKSLTVTLYGGDGKPLAGRLARTYIDGVLAGSVTTDGDGAMGVTFVPGRRGARRLVIRVDGEPGPAVDAPLEIS